ncbi:hypothetical protein NP233_g5042 [Leucocoprinus birnbaumii]|uniref:FAD-binding PCMH-type domain-containing protein n=1 Tax=Leucocoprinus birnbaumii TaxID=56174 RepID=A0AAD5VV00_9AGAR|nr:hypothetical protein NP233_g5042 [Leucocoprinus birnbaumii]
MKFFGSLLDIAPFLLLELVQATTAKGNSKCRCIYGESCWPSDDDFKTLSAQLSQPLIHPVPAASACYPVDHHSGNCSDVQENWFNGIWRSNQPGAYENPNFETYTNKNGSLSGCYLNTTLGLPCEQGSVPPIGIDARTIEDVQAAVRFVGQHNLRFAVKNTGHDYLGRSAGKGAFMIWTHNLKNITYNANFIPEGGSSAEAVAAFTVGAGVQWSEAYEAAREQQRFIVGGLSSDMSNGAAGGWIMGGGHSAFSPTYGLGVDNVIQFTIVQPDGEHVVANAHNNADLFWALRGGGAGSWGVVTSATYRTYELIPLSMSVINVTFPNPEVAQAVGTKFVGLHPQLSDMGWGGYSFITNDTLFAAFVAPNVSLAEHNTTMNPFVDFTRNATGGSGVEIFVDAYDNFHAWLAVLEAGGSAGGMQQLGGNVELASRLLSREAAEQRPEETARLFLSFDLIAINFVAGGAVARANPDSVALNPGWRKAVAMAYTADGWEDGASGEVVRAARQRVAEYVRRLDPISPDSTTYMNEASLYEPNFKKSFFGDHYDRLRQIKRKYDPKSFFLVAEGVGSEDWDASLTCPLPKTMRKPRKQGTLAPRVESFVPPCGKHSSLGCKVLAAAPKGPWDQFNIAPKSRDSRPIKVHSVRGEVQDPGALIGSGTATFAEDSSFVVLDFGQEVGGRVFLNVDSAGENSSLSLSFTESAEFINPTTSDSSCRAVASMDGDGIQLLPGPLQQGLFMQTIGEQRGGFRYLTIISNSDASVGISGVGVQNSFMPHWDSLTAYTGYFFANDPGFHDPDFLTKLWYAGAYTVQTNTIDVHQARQQPCPTPQGWANNATGGPVEGPVLVDGAKRDRNIWPGFFIPSILSQKPKLMLGFQGDLGISTNTELVALNDILPSKNALLVMFSTQDPATGALQYSGPPINARGSDTYIAWSLIGTYNVWLYTGDLDFVQTVWANYTKAIAFLQNQVDETGLMNVPQSFANDWGREGGQGHNSAANVLLYRALVVSSELASELGDTDSAASFAANASSLKEAINNILWDDQVGLYRDNDLSTIHPQDGNAMAVVFNVTETQGQNEAVSLALTQFWTDIGPLSPELNDTIIPFIGGFEVAYSVFFDPCKKLMHCFKVQAHFIAGEGERAIDLLHKANGSLGYRSAAGANFDHSFTSHSHGWATGPTSALTFHVLGIGITSPQGKSWAVNPVLSGLDSAEGGFETTLGWFGVKWEANETVLTIQVTTPHATTGTVNIPGSGQIQVDGEPVDGGKLTMLTSRLTILMVFSIDVS